MKLAVPTYILIRTTKKRNRKHFIYIVFIYCILSYVWIKNSIWMHIIELVTYLKICVLVTFIGYLHQDSTYNVNPT